MPEESLFINTLKFDYPSEKLNYYFSLNAGYYFAHPYSSWEKGLNEYINGLIQQYMPKKQLYANNDDDFIKNVQHKINRRPRKKT